MERGNGERKWREEMEKKYEITVPVPSRSQFVQAIREFKKQHQGKLKDLLDKQRNPDVIQAFWANPIIHSYLSRDASHVEFDEHDRPKLTDSKEKEQHDSTDHYELKVYKYLSDEIIYRNTTMMDLEQSHLNFYQQRMTDTRQETVRQTIDNVSEDIAPPAHTNSDYELAMHINKLQFQFNDTGKQSPRFFPFFAAGSGHVVAALSIVDPATRRVLTTLLLNSSVPPTYGYWSKDTGPKEAAYVTRIKSRFSIPNFYCAPSSGSPQIALDRTIMKHHIENLFSIDIDDVPFLEKGNIDAVQKKSNILINPLDKSACIVDLQSEYGGMIPKIYRNVWESPNIENLYLIGNLQSQNSTSVSVWSKPTGAVVDASHNLQTAADDMNCGLYTTNFIKAITELLKQPGRADEIYQLAQAADQNNLDAQQQLAKIFREDCFPVSLN